VEILLNLAWAALAVFIVCLWLRLGDRTGLDRRRQIIALVVLLAILFPVISVSDDLMAAQTATEQDSCQRRDYLAPSSAHPIVPLAAIVYALHFEMSFGTPRFIAIRTPSLPSVEHPELGGIENRPPPAA
jgi:hypothetical protein